jgi:tetratricopeptide (TPR) repeat protein
MAHVVLAIILLFAYASLQVEDARQAIERHDYIRAVEILAPITYKNATTDIYLYRGIAYANLKEYRRALEAFRQGFRRNPDDPRFHPTRVRSNFRAGDIEQAKQEIGQALAVNPDDAFAAELLADLEISEGNTALGLRILNERNQPRLLRIGPNYSLSFSDWIVPRSVVFHPGDVLTVGRWQTTQARLWASNAFSHVALELEPSSSKITTTRSSAPLLA